MPPPEARVATDTISSELRSLSLHNNLPNSLGANDDTESPCDPDAPFHIMLERMEASSAFPSQPSSSNPPSVTPLRAPSDLGDYAPSEVTATSADTMVTWQPTPYVAGAVGVQTVVAPTVQDDRPDTPVPPRIAVQHHRDQRFETPGHRAHASLGQSSRSRSTLRLDESHEPEPFDGAVGKRCCQFIHAIRNYAWKNDMRNDPKWTAEYAGTRLTDEALVWHSRQPAHVKEDWRQLENALLHAFYPGYSDNPELLPFTPGSSPGTTPSTQAAFSPNTTGSSSSSNNPLSPPVSSPMLSPLRSPPIDTLQSLSQSSRRSAPVSSHVSLASESSQRIQRGQLMIVDSNENSYYVRIEVNRWGGCMPTRDRSKSLRVWKEIATPRQLFLDNCSSHHTTLGVAWCIKPSYTPHLNKGSFDCADLVYFHNGSTSSTKAFGPSRDVIWTVKEDKNIQASWLDGEQVEHELHAVMKPEGSLFRSPARIVLVKDPDAFTRHHPEFIRSRLVFEP